MGWKAKAEYVIKDVDLEEPIVNVQPYTAMRLQEIRESPLRELDKKVRHADLQPFYKRFEGKHKKKHR